MRTLCKNSLDFVVQLDEILCYLFNIILFILLLFNIIIYSAFCSSIRLLPFVASRGRQSQSIGDGDNPSQKMDLHVTVRTHDYRNIMVRIILTGTGR